MEGGRGERGERGKGRGLEREGEGKGERGKGKGERGKGKGGKKEKKGEPLSSNCEHGHKILPKQQIAPFSFPLKTKTKSIWNQQKKKKKN